MTATPEQQADILERLKNGVVEYDEETVVKAANEALSLDMNAYQAVMDGLAAGMDVVGKYFASGEYFVPEVLMCADALYGGLNILKPHIKLDPSKQVKGSVVIGTVEGDIHNIGKNLVGMLLQGAGFKVIDLGMNVTPAAFVKAALEHKADIVAMSALLTTTMIQMKTVIQSIQAAGLKTPVIVGGAPLTQDYADQIGARGYAPDAASAVDVVNKLI